MLEVRVSNIKIEAKKKEEGGGVEVAVTLEPPVRTYPRDTR